MFVYLINAEGTDLYKIGVSKNPRKRILALQTGSSRKLRLVNEFRTDYFSLLEKTLHRVYSPFKKDMDDDVIGEWFYFEEGQANEFLSQCSSIIENFKILESNSTLRF